MVPLGGRQLLRKKKIKLLGWEVVDVEPGYTSIVTVHLRALLPMQREKGQPKRYGSDGDWWWWSTGWEWPHLGQ